MAFSALAALKHFVDQLWKMLTILCCTVPQVQARFIVSYNFLYIVDLDVRGQFVDIGSFLVPRGSQR